MNPKLTDEQKDLLIGTLLGDGNLQSNNKGRTWRYRALHKSDHKDYLYHKYEILKVFCGTPPSYMEILDSRTAETYSRFYFNTLTNDSFRFFGNLFYKYDLEKDLFRKDVPIIIEKYLTPRAIAYWYMDDGALKWIGKSNAMVICTESFSEMGVRRLKSALESRYQISTQLISKNLKGELLGYRLSINEKNASAFRELIKPYIIKVMAYKVSDGARGHL